LNEIAPPGQLNHWASSFSLTGVTYQAFYTERSMASAQKYSRLELQNLRDDAWPDRGEYCQKCTNIVPSFEDISDEDIEDLRALIAAGNVMSAMQKIHDKTGCSLRWAKIWVHHPYGGHTISQRPTPPCPYCGSQLRTPSARQCPVCYGSWHEEE